jgi:hypothetical protein
MHRMPKSSALGPCERGLNFKRSTWLPCVQFPLLIPHDSRFASYVMQTGPPRGERHGGPFQYAVCFVSGHDFSRAAKVQNKVGLSPLQGL